MKQLSRGERLPLDAHVPDGVLQAGLAARGLALDFACFALDASGKLLDDRYMTFFNQPTSPCGGVRSAAVGADKDGFALQLARLPAAVERVVITASIDGSGVMSQLQSGRIRLGGRDAGALPTHARARAGLAYVPQGREIFKSLTVEENLLSAVQSTPPRAALERAYALFPRLHERRRNGGGQLSGGEQQMLAVARALMAEPQIVLFDEPLEGLAPKVRDELMDAIQRLVRERGVGCLLVEQHVDVVLDFVDRVIVLERGVPVFHGTSAELRADPALLDRTIGLEKV